jgi:hypothetical protein
MSTVTSVSTGNIVTSDGSRISLPSRVDSGCRSILGKYQANLNSSGDKLLDVSGSIVILKASADIDISYCISTIESVAAQQTFQDIASTLVQLGYVRRCARKYQRSTGLLQHSLEVRSVSYNGDTSNYLLAYSLRQCFGPNLLTSHFYPWLFRHGHYRCIPYPKRYLYTTQCPLECEYTQG